MPEPVFTRDAAPLSSTIFALMEREFLVLTMNSPSGTRMRPLVIVAGAGAAREEIPAWESVRSNDAEIPGFGCPEKLFWRFSVAWVVELAGEVVPVAEILRLAR